MERLVCHVDLKTKVSKSAVSHKHPKVHVAMFDSSAQATKVHVSMS